MSKLTRLGEIIGLIITGVAIVFKLQNFSYANEFFLVGLMTLGIIYFLESYIPAPKPPENEKLEFSDLLVTIVRKVMYIGISVLCVAYLFAILHLKGANEMMIIGLFTLVISLVVSMVLVLGKRERMVHIRGPLVRSIAALILYFITPLLS